MNLSAAASSDLSLARRRRICRRVAGGWPLVEAAAVEGISAGEAEALAREPDFLALAKACEHVVREPVQDRRRRLVQMAWAVLEAAAIAGDPRVALFFLKEEIRGRRPVEVIAKAVCNPLNGKPPPTPMTVFVPPHWQQPLRKAPKDHPFPGSARSAPRRLSTMQVIYLRIRTRNRTLAIGSATPPENQPRRPNGP